METEINAAMAADKSPVKIRIASLSPFHCSVIFISSSYDLSGYTENEPSDLSTDLCSPSGSSGESISFVSLEEFMVWDIVN